MEDERKYAKFELGGLMRCCAESIPADEDSRVLAGEEGQHIPCKYGCKEPDGGVTFKDGVWKSAYIVNNADKMFKP